MQELPGDAGAKRQKMAHGSISHLTPRIEQIAAEQPTAFGLQASIWFGRELAALPPSDMLSVSVQELLSELHSGTKGSVTQIKALRHNLKLIQARLETSGFGAVQAVAGIREVLDLLKPRAPLTTEVNLETETDPRRLLASLEEADERDMKDQVIQCARRMFSSLHIDLEGGIPDDVRQVLRAMVHLLKPYSVRGELGELQEPFNMARTLLIVEPVHFLWEEEPRVATENVKEFIDKALAIYRELEELPVWQYDLEKTIWKGIKSGKIAISETELQSYLTQIQEITPDFKAKFRFADYFLLHNPRRTLEILEQAVGEDPNSAEMAYNLLMEEAKAKRSLSPECSAKCFEYHVMSLLPTVSPQERSQVMANAAIAQRQLLTMADLVIEEWRMTLGNLRIEIDPLSTKIILCYMDPMTWTKQGKWDIPLTDGGLEEKFAAVRKEKDEAMKRFAEEEQRIGVQVVDDFATIAATVGPEREKPPYQILRKAGTTLYDIRSYDEQVDRSSLEGLAGALKNLASIKIRRQVRFLLQDFPQFLTPGTSQDVSKIGLEAGTGSDDFVISLPVRIGLKDISSLQRMLSSLQSALSLVTAESIDRFPVTFRNLYMSFDGELFRPFLEKVLWNALCRKEHGIAPDLIERCIIECETFLPPFLRVDLKMIEFYLYSRKDTHEAFVVCQKLMREFPGNDSITALQQIAPSLAFRWNALQHLTVLHVDEASIARIMASLEQIEQFPEVALGKLTIDKSAEGTLIAFYLSPLTGKTKRFEFSFDDAELLTHIATIVHDLQNEEKQCAAMEERIGIIPHADYRKIWPGPGQEDRLYVVARRPDSATYDVHYYDYEDVATFENSFSGINKLDNFLRKLTIQKKRHFAKLAFLQQNPQALFASICDPAAPDKIFIEEIGQKYVVRAFVPKSFDTVSIEIDDLSQYAEASIKLQQMAQVNQAAIVSVENALNTLSKTVSQSKAPELTDEQKKAAPLARYMEAFEAINFSNSSKPYYRPRPRNYAALKKGLQDVIGVVSGTIREFTALPRDPVKRKAMLDLIERYLKGIILLYQQRERSAELEDSFQAVALSLAQMGLQCATNWEGEVATFYELESMGEITKATAHAEFDLREFVQQAIDSVKRASFDELLTDGRDFAEFDPSHGARFYDISLTNRGYAIHPQKRVAYEDIYEESGKRGKYKTEAEVARAFENKCNAARIAVSVQEKLNAQMGSATSYPILKAFYDYAEEAFPVAHIVGQQKLEYEGQKQQILDRKNSETDLTDEESAFLHSLQGISRLDIIKNENRPLKEKLLLLARLKPNKMAPASSLLERWGVELIDFDTQISRLYLGYRGALDAALQELLVKEGFFEMLGEEKDQCHITLKATSRLLFAMGYFEPKTLTSDLPAQVEQFNLQLVEIYRKIFEIRVLINEVRIKPQMSPFVERLQVLRDNLSAQHETLLSQKMAYVLANFPENPFLFMAIPCRAYANCYLNVQGSKEKIEELLHTEISVLKGWLETAPQLNDGESRLRCRLTKTLYGVSIPALDKLREAGFTESHIVKGGTALSEQHLFLRSDPDFRIAFTKNPHALQVQELTHMEEGRTRREDPNSLPTLHPSWRPA